MTVQFDLNMDVVKLVSLYTIVVAVIGGMSFILYKKGIKGMFGKIKESNIGIKIKSLAGFVKEYIDKRRIGIWTLKVKRFLLKYDMIWSIPLGFFLFTVSAHIVQKLYPQAGIPDVGFITPLVLSITVTLGFFGGALLIIKLFFKSIDGYIYGKKIDGVWINKSKEDFSKVEPQVRLLTSLVIFLFTVALIVATYVSLV